MPEATPEFLGLSPSLADHLRARRSEVVEQLAKAVRDGMEGEELDELARSLLSRA